MLDKTGFPLRRWFGRIPRYAYLGGGVGVALTRPGRKIFLPAGDLDLAPDIALHGRCQPALEATLRRLLRPGAVVAEVGTHIGYHTLAMAERIGPRGHLHAFEAAPGLTRLLRRSLSANGFDSRVTLHEAAVLHAEGAVEFAFDPAEPCKAQLVLPAMSAAWSGRFVTPSRRLDDVLGALPALDLLRLDAEGTEGLALIGAAALLARSPNLVIVASWAPESLAHRGSVAELAAWLAGHGFRFQRMDGPTKLTRVAVADLPGLPPCTLVMRREG